MLALGSLLDSLAPVVEGLAAQIGTDSFFVLRQAETDDGRGGTRKSWSPTSAAAIPCFMAVVEARSREMEEFASSREFPVVFRRIVCKAAADVTPRDRARVVARGATPQLDQLEIVRAAPLSGVLLEIVTAEEQKEARVA